MVAHPATTTRPSHPDDWRPHAGPQEHFLDLSCFEALYGGAAGGGKSDALLVDAIRYVGRGYGTKYQALLLRRTFPELYKSLILRSFDLYPRLGGIYNEGRKDWTFPQKERVTFGHVEYEKSVHQYQGAAFQYVGFDELTSFTRYQYTYMFSRARSAYGVRCRIRAATNPGNEGHDWVFERWGSWLNPEHERPAEFGKVRHFTTGPDGVELVVPRGTPRSKGRTFVPARLEDNPSLFADGEYEASLYQLDPVTRAQLRGGNWLIKPAAGLYFKRSKIQIVDAVPAGAARVRYWDRAASEPRPEYPDPDWSVGAKLALHEGIVYIEDVFRMRGRPGDVQAAVRTTAELDGKHIPIGLEQEPGASGVSEIEEYMRLLQGWDVRANKKRVNKIVAAGPISAQADAGNVRMLRGAWNEAVLQVLEQFPDGSHDDDVDAISGAYTTLADGVRMPIRKTSESRPAYRMTISRGY